MRSPTPIADVASSYEYTDRKKGDPITPYFFTKIKEELADVENTGATHKQIASLYHCGASSVKLINIAPNFHQYQELRATKSNWVKPVLRVPKVGLLQRIFKRK